MNNPNNNFLDTDEIIEEIEEEIIEETQEATQTNAVINEAMKRIEQAKLYESFLNHNLFAPGSAKPEIIATVRKELKEFVQFRLEVLLGIRPDGKVGSTIIAQPVAVKLPFDETEIAALKDIAKRLVDKNKTVSSVPSINSVSVPQPQIQQVEVQQPQMIASPAQTTTRKVTRRVVKRNGQVISTEDVPQQNAAPAPAPAKSSRRKSANVSVFTGDDLSQATNPAKPPIPMPSQNVQDMMNANLADKNSRGGLASINVAPGSNMDKALTSYLTKG